MSSSSLLKLSSCSKLWLRVGMSGLERNTEDGHDGHSIENIGNAFFRQKNRSSSYVQWTKSSPCSVG